MHSHKYIGFLADAHTGESKTARRRDKNNYGSTEPRTGFMSAFPE